MSTNLSVIKNPRVQSDQRRLVRRPDVKPNRPLIVILSTVALDAVGIGLIMPVLPGLLRDLVHSNDVTAHYGILLALYALMQFACAPVLGALSDRFGRRPVLLVSLAGAAVDYAIMAMVEAKRLAFEDAARYWGLLAFAGGLGRRVVLVAQQRPDASGNTP